MTTQRENPPDGIVEQIAKRFAEYEAKHPRSKIDVYRQNPVSIRIRLIDPRFGGIDRVDREEEIWRYLEALPEELLADVTMLLVLTPEEAEKSFANYEFEHPLPSRL
jgi:hypothetical protein